MPYRSQTVLGDMKQAVDEALAAKAKQLWQERVKITNFQCLAA
jgi:hypothetical protein